MNEEDIKTVVLAVLRESTDPEFSPSFRTKEERKAYYDSELDAQEFVAKKVTDAIMRLARATGVA